MESKNIVGSRVRQARKASKPGITQKDLVARLQTLGVMIDQSGLSKIENGQSDLPPITVPPVRSKLHLILPLWQEVDNQASYEVGCDYTPASIVQSRL